MGETIAAALAAHGERVLGHHPRDGAPQGLFCASGQCAQCMVIADGRPVKACTARVRPRMHVEPADGLPVLPPASEPVAPRETPVVKTRVLVVGGGPAGMAAARELDRHGLDTVLVDDKPRLGGKLVLQTHRFFGWFNAVHAGTRGVDIAARMEREVRACPHVHVWTGSTALAVFEDRRVGVLRGAEGEGGEYVLVEPEALLVAAGAAEKLLAFPGNTLPGVLGAGAFQTLLHRDLVRPADRVLVVGGGNVGLIVACQAIQAGIEVAALVEALPACGGYKVHHDKLARLGVPVHTSTTLVSANGREGVESATIAAVGPDFKPIAGTERTLACDSVLLAVGLEPLRELFDKACEMGLPAYRAGDAEEVAEASAAIFGGRIRGLSIARSLGATVEPVPHEWHRSLEILRSRPGEVHPPESGADDHHGVEPVIHCVQEIPCDPCSASCPQGGIRVDPDDIRHVPQFVADALGKACVGCEKCVTICPGQAITLVDDRKDPEHPFVIVPFELPREGLAEGGRVVVVDVDGHILGAADVVRIRGGAAADHTLAVKLRAERAIARRIAGIRLHEPPPEATVEEWTPHQPGDTIVCRCERVAAGLLRDLVRAGHRDINEIKVLTRAGLGACGARTCGPLLHRIFREEGVSGAEIGEPRRRPLLVEVPLAVLAGAVREGRHG
jgi:NADPH-dependent 2,4-dienoyl-CoA reductase/sulfur reductase-like enzyme/Fe-S-cluster-containing hydrogenase component 2